MQGPHGCLVTPAQLSVGLEFDCRDGEEAGAAWGLLL